MDQNPTASLKTEQKPSGGSASSQLFGGNFKKDNLEKRVQELMRESTEYHELKQYVIDQGVSRIQSEGLLGRMKPALPSFIALIVSIFMDVAKVPFLGKVAENMANWVFPGSTTLNKGVDPVTLWWMPFIVYGIFILCAELSYRKLLKEVSTKGVSQEIIERITNRYASIVDGLGTALPLLGAAILLISIKEGPIIFLGFSVPFEIKSIIILAIAKLFEIVFDSQGLQFAELREDLNDLEKEYFTERDDIHQRAILQQLHDGFSRRGSDAVAGMEKFTKEEAAEIMNSLKKAAEFGENISKNVVIMKNAISEMSKTNVHDSDLLKELQNTTQSLTTALSAATQTAEYSEIMKKNLEAMRGLMVEMNNIKYPDQNLLKELQITAHMLTETANSLKDAQAIKGLDNLAYLAGKRSS
jgi:methyl-accepting chemotaxis protein